MLARAAAPARNALARHALRALAAGLLVGGLAACAGSDPLAGLTPPNPQVPPVESDQFPTVGAPPSDRAAPLTPEGQQKLQKDLERAARQQARTQ